MYQKRRRIYRAMGYQMLASKREEIPSVVYTGVEFLKIFEADIAGAAEEIVLWNSGLTTERLRDVGVALKEALARGVKVTIHLSRNSGETAEYLKSLDVAVQEEPEQTYSAAIIDRRVVWYGNTSFFGTPARDMLRFESRDVAGEMLASDTTAGAVQLSFC